MTSHQKWRHQLIWSCFWLIFSIFSKLGAKTFWILMIFYFQLLWLAKPRIIIITFINFRTLKGICVWTTTRIDLKFSGHLQGINVYSQKYGFLMAVFWLKVMGQNNSKSVFFQFFIFWSVKYIQIVTSSNFLGKLIWTIVKTFTKFHCYAVSLSLKSSLKLPFLEGVLARE